MCTTKRKGSWRLPGNAASSMARATSWCKKRCLWCERCVAISVNREFMDCSWFDHCELGLLNDAVPGFRTLRLLSRAAPPRLPARTPPAWLQSVPPEALQGTIPWKIFIYDFDEAVEDFDIVAPFGRPLIDGDASREYSYPWRETTAASSATFMAAVFARAAYHRTRDPAEATLFFIPAFEDSQWCTNPAAKLRQHWRTGVDYFARRRGRDHLAVFYHAGQLISREHCLKWAMPDSPMVNVSKAVGGLREPWIHSRPLELQQRWASQYSVFEVPEGGSVYHPAYWAEQSHERPLLLLASYNSVGHRNVYRQMDVRKVMERQCARAPDCEFVSLQARLSLNHDQHGFGILRTVFGKMHRAVFSLQPAGDWPNRKGIIDSLTLGCIPVLSHAEQRVLWPQHWGPWANDSHVYLPFDDVLSGKVQLLAALRAIPRRRVDEMRRTIARNALSLVYSMRPTAHDAFEILVREAARRREVTGYKGYG